MSKFFLLSRAKVIHSKTCMIKDYLVILKDMNLDFYNHNSNQSIMKITKTLVCDFRVYILPIGAF